MTGLAAALDEFRARHQVPGVAVATFDLDGPQQTVARGVRSAEEPGAAMRPDTLFRVYSVAKSLTGTLATMLAEDGVVDLDQPVVETLPRFRLRGGSGTGDVTLRHLLSHRAGFIPDAVSHEHCGRDPEAIAAAATGEPPRTPLVGRPGQVYSYSNLGFIVAGHVLETRAGVAFATLFQDRVTRPLGMHRTTHDPAVAMTYPLLQHHPAGALRVGHQPWVAAKHAPSSQCWSTVQDMARFGAMHLAGGAAALRQRRPHADVRLDVDLRYGLGLYLGPRDGEEVRFGHEGFYDGMWCKLVCVPAAGVGLVWADNRGDELRDARYRVIEQILGVGPGDWSRHHETPQPQRTPPPDGRYERPASGAALHIRSGDDGIRLHTEGRELVLDPVATDVWATTADEHARPPWRTHAGSRRVSVGAVRGEPGGEVGHILLNGLPYRRHGSSPAHAGTH
ncbi:beta-lactamase family protein [Dactylosporangium sp. NBC_01737]|uniref:serine hydrolase domain-containing protein n=1 Tax=Dactylosporangium sp. NBC_01737 TaxID=2975959 RepID=UPI002E0F2242|nr:beta-lactamase family protein [Dactylosporangium sp. NBC_01737]